MAFSFSTNFLLFLWFSGVNYFVNPSAETGSGMVPEVDYQEQQDQELLPMEDRYMYMHRFRFAVPPGHIDPIQEPIRRQYRLEDFLWTGSGDGPYPSELDGGLAWEDNGGSPGGIPGSPEQSRSWIKVTKTVTIYRTALTTIYPVEMTPVVVSGAPPSVQPTPHLSDSRHFSESAHPASDSLYSDYLGPSDNVMWIPTPTFSPTPPPQTHKPLPSPTIDITAFATASVHPTSVPQDNFSAESTDMMYWIQTSIKANTSTFKDAPFDFQNKMQKNLARVYASAFKRHLLSTLGVLSSSLSPTKNSSQRRKRRRRWTSNPYEEDYQDKQNNLEHDHIHRWLYVAQSSMTPTQLKHLATTSMNVTVTILNVTEDRSQNIPQKVDLTYIVLAEGTPVPAFSAVKELDLVTKEEMEHEIGYEIIDKKAEALVAGPPEQIARNEQIVATSPWLIVAITTICLLVILLTLIAFMVWKWKHNRLGDSNNRRVPPAARPQSGIIEIEEGVINPAFLGTPSRTGHGESHEQTPKSSPALSLLSARARTSAKKISEAISRRRGSGLGSFRQRRKDEEDENDDDQVEGKRGRGKRKYKGGKGQEGDSPTTSEELRLHKKTATPANLTSSEGSADWKELLGEPKPKMTTSGRSRERSPMRGKTMSNSEGGKKEPKDTLQRRRRRKTHISKIEEISTKSDEEDSEISQFSDIEELDRSVTPKSEEPQRKQQQLHSSWAKGMTDAISLGNLDICQDSIAQIPSEYAKKLVPWKRPSSAVSAGGSKSHHYHVPSSSSGMESSQGRRPGSRVALPETIEEIPSFDLTEEEEGEGSKEQDRDLSERSFEMKDEGKTPGMFGSPPDTKDAQVQTPKRISKTASHKTRAAPKPRKSWKGSPGRGQSESVISTESEEIVEIHHVNSSTSDEQNPLGRMRKRFHQFLDDAFNVMVSGGKREETDNKAETQSAKVSICHEVVETETDLRPWTSHVIREETLQKLRRPKSAAVPIGPPKRAWTASSERRTSSAKVKASESSSAPGGTTSRIGSAVDFQRRPPLRPTTSQHRIDDDDDDDDTYDKTSTPCVTTHDDSKSARCVATTTTDSRSSVLLSPAFVFPQYPTYPDIRVSSARGASPSSTTISSSQAHTQQQPGPSSAAQTQPQPPSLPSNDPAVPLIQAIKNEMKRFEREPSAGSK